MVNVWYRLIDFLLPTLSFYLLYRVVSQPSFTESHFWFSFVAGSLFVFMTQLLGGYQASNKRTIARKLEVLFKGWIFVILGMVFTAYLLGVLDSVSRTIFVLWAVLVPLLVLMSKVLINRICMMRIDKHDQWLLVGEKYDFNGLEKAFLDKQKITIDHICHRDIEALQTYLTTNLVAGVVLNVKEPASNRLVQLLTRSELAGIKLYSMNHFFEQNLRKSFIPYDVIGVDYLDDVKRLSNSQYFLKRLLDLSVSGSLLLISFPIMLYSVIKIKKQSPGAVFFKQSRIGQDAKSFEVIKFRTMTENSHFDPYTQKEDMRIYPYGQFMRKSRIDELPQLWNVIRGDMHLCGPRTEWDILVEGYEKEIPFYHERHLIKPGITGWAQVMYPYGANTEDARQKLMYDLYYIKHWSVWLEIETLLRTVSVVLGKKGI